MSGLGTIPFPEDAAFELAMKEMVCEVNGMIYAGNDLETCVRVIKWLRTNPERAAFLLGEFEG